MTNKTLKGCEELARRIALSSGTVGDFVQYFSIRKLNKNIARVEELDNNINKDLML